MSTREEIMYLEERLRQAELGPDPSFFEEYLADGPSSTTSNSKAGSSRPTGQALEEDRSRADV